MDTAARDHLRAATELLSFSSPGIACHLAASLAGAQIASDSLRLHDKNRTTCPQCGIHLLVGRNAQIMRSKTPRTRQDRLNMKAIIKAVKVRCDQCSHEFECTRERRVDRPTLAIEQVKVLAVPKSTAVPVASDHVHKKQSLEKDASMATQRQAISQTQANETKKRSRAKKSSLQAMLANRKSTAPSSGGAGFGLDLMDFMKT